jgi:hypothetical protein
MKRTAKFALFLLAGFVVLSVSMAVAPYFLDYGRRASHIGENVPDPAQFATILARDLDGYFSRELASQVVVKFQLLRDGPTQSGVAFPKFYAWVTVSSLQSGQKIAEGAVRLSAENKASLSVTDFIPADDIKKRPDDLKRLFPSDVMVKIDNHL